MYAFDVNVIVQANIDIKPQSMMKYISCFISQSGVNCRYFGCTSQSKRIWCKTYAIVNVIGSALSKEADHVIYTQAGKEVSVATTKAYCSQLCILSLMTIHLALLHNKLSSEDLKGNKRRTFSSSRLYRKDD